MLQQKVIDIMLMVTSDFEKNPEGVYICTIVLPYLVPQKVGTRFCETSI
jgi:hypothetical protein